MKHDTETREKVDRCILDANLGRLTEQETIDLIHERVGITISKSHVAKRRYYLKKDTEKMWERYRKDNFAYKLLHSELMNEADNVRARLNKQIIALDNGDKHNFFYLQKSFNSLVVWNKRKQELIEQIPAIDAIGHSYSNPYFEQGVAMANAMVEQISGVEPETNTEVGTFSQRKF